MSRRCSNTPGPADRKGIDMEQSTKLVPCPGCGILITPDQRASPANPDRDPESPPEAVHGLNGEQVADLCLFCDRTIPAEDGDVIRELIKTRRHLHDDSELILPSGRTALAGEVNRLMYQWGAEERARIAEEAVGPALRRSEERRRAARERLGMPVIEETVESTVARRLRP